MKVSLNATHKTKKSNAKDGIAISYAPTKRPFPWLRWYFIVLLVLSPLLYFTYNLVSGFFIIDSPAVVFLERVVVSMPRSGFIEMLSADVATHVSKGDPIMKVLPETWKSDLHNIELLKERARYLYDLPHESRVLVSPAGVSAESIRLAQRTLDYWHRNRLVYEELRKKGAATEAEYREALERENSERNTLIQLRRHSTAVYADAPEDVSLLLERMRLNQEIAQLEKNLTGEIVISPISGRIAEISANAGQTLPLGATVVEIVNTEKAKILAYVEERALDYVFSKSSVAVEFPGKVSVMCRLANMPLQTGSIPGNITTAFITGRAVLVELEPLVPLPSEYLVDGLPVKVHWGVWKPELLSGLLLRVLSGLQSLKDLFT